MSAINASQSWLKMENGRTMDDLTVEQVLTAFRKGYISIGELEDELIDRGLHHDYVDDVIKCNVVLRRMQEIKDNKEWDFPIAKDQSDVHDNVIMLDKYR